MTLDDEETYASSCASCDRDCETCSLRRYFSPVKEIFGDMDPNIVFRLKFCVLLRLAG